MKVWFVRIPSFSPTISSYENITFHKHKKRVNKPLKKKNVASEKTEATLLIWKLLWLCAGELAGCFFSRPNDATLRIQPFGYLVLQPYSTLDTRRREKLSPETPAGGKNLLEHLLQCMTPNKRFIMKRHPTLPHHQLLRKGKWNAFSFRQNMLNWESIPKSPIKHRQILSLVQTGTLPKGPVLQVIQ